jgi:two-component system nitrogen regulation sensor histidine kinase NtrY
MVDEFSEFARMPEPKKISFNVIEIIEEVVLLQSSANSEIRFVKNYATLPVLCSVDPSLMNQVFNNLLKNAIESIETAINRNIIGSKKDGVIKVHVLKSETEIQIKFKDNGIGLPKKTSHLFEPYVTSRGNGIGLGLAIVKKIIEEHDGHLVLSDSECFDNFNHKGAIAQVSLPLLNEKNVQIQLL